MASDVEGGYHSEQSGPGFGVSKLELVAVGHDDVLDVVLVQEVFVVFPPDPASHRPRACRVGHRSSHRIRTGYHHNLVGLLDVGVHVVLLVVAAGGADVCSLWFAFALWVFMPMAKETTDCTFGSCFELADPLGLPLFCNLVIVCATFVPHLPVLVLGGLHGHIAFGDFLWKFSLNSVFDLVVDVVPVVGEFPIG